MQNKQLFDRIGLALIVVRNSKKQYLTVLETNDRGWWLPGGRVEPCEQFEEAALRETLEEAGIHITLKGVLRVEYAIDQLACFMRFKIIYYAEPIDEKELPKSKADSESILAKWVDYKDLPQLSTEGPGWRGPELLEWSNYIENGGIIYPLSVTAREGSQVKLAQPIFTM